MAATLRRVVAAMVAHHIIVELAVPLVELSTASTTQAAARHQQLLLAVRQNPQHRCPQLVQQHPGRRRSVALRIHNPCPLSAGGCGIPATGENAQVKYRNVRIDGAVTNCDSVFSGQGSVGVLVQMEHTGRCETGCPGCTKAGKYVLKNPSGTIVAAGSCVFQHSGSDCSWHQYDNTFQIDTSILGDWTIHSYSGWSPCGGEGDYGVVAKITVIVQTAAPTKAPVRRPTKAPATAAATQCGAQHGKDGRCGPKTNAVFSDSTGAFPDLTACRIS
eukprot:gene57305-biopygen28044